MSETTQTELQAAESFKREKIRTPMALRDGHRVSTLRVLSQNEIEGVRGGYSDPGPNCNRWGFGC